MNFTSGDAKDQMNIKKIKVIHMDKLKVKRFMGNKSVSIKGFISNNRNRTNEAEISPFKPPLTSSPDFKSVSRYTERAVIKKFLNIDFIQYRHCEQREAIPYEIATATS